MKIFISLIILIFFQEQNTSAQVKVRAGFGTSFVNPSMYIFEQNPKIEVVLIRGEKGKSQSVSIYYVGTSMNVTMDEYYDLFFAGDQHMLRKKYPKFEIPRVPEFKMNYLPNMKLDSAYRRNFFFVTTEIRKDSIKQNYSFYTAEGRSEATLKYTGNRPRWKGDMAKLSAKLNESFSGLKSIKSLDTIVILKSIVTRNGKLKPLEVIEGAKFPYADKLAELIQNEAIEWNPAIVGSVPVDADVRIVITRKQDKRLVISIL